MCAIHSQLYLVLIPNNKLVIKFIMIPYLNHLFPYGGSGKCSSLKMEEKFQVKITNI